MSLKVIEVCFEDTVKRLRETTRVKKSIEFKNYFFFLVFPFMLIIILGDFYVTWVYWPDKELLFTWICPFVLFWFFVLVIFYLAYKCKAGKDEEEFNSLEAKLSEECPKI